MYIIYVLRWPRSSKIYVGRTSDPVTRLAAHKRTLKPLGLGDPSMETLEDNLTEAQAFLAEQKWIKFLGSSVEFGNLNKTYGGEFGKEVRARKWHGD